MKICKSLRQMTENQIIFWLGKSAKFNRPLLTILCSISPRKTKALTAEVEEIIIVGTKII